MFRLWGKIFKDNRMLKDSVINNKGNLSRKIRGRGKAQESEDIRTRRAGKGAPPYGRCR